MTTQDRIAAARHRIEEICVHNDADDPTTWQCSRYAARLIAALGPEQEARDRVVEAARAWRYSVAQPDGTEDIATNEDAALVSAVAALEALSDE
jgi:hypothetical protein